MTQVDRIFFFFKNHDTVELPNPLWLMGKGYQVTDTRFRYGGYPVIREWGCDWWARDRRVKGVGSRHEPHVGLGEVDPPS